MQPSLFGDELKIPPRIGHATVVDAPGSQLLCRPAGSLKAFDYSLNPYRGCSFACSYCYAAAFVPDKAMREDWGNWVAVKSSALSQLGKKRDLLGARILIGSATDAYQPIERRLELTRSIVEFLSDERRQPRLAIQTRSPLATRDIDLFLRYRRFRINFSITTDDDEVRKRFEPMAPGIERRIAAAEECVAAGLRVGVSVAPMLPMRNIEGFAKRLKGMGVVEAWAGQFHDSDRPFSADTRSSAVAVLRESGWNRDARAQAIARFERAMAP